LNVEVVNNFSSFQFVQCERVFT